MAESFLEEDLDAQKARNESLVEVFLEHGADLGEKRPIDFFFYANSQQDAIALAADLGPLGFASVDVANEAFDGKWGVTAVRLDSIAAVTDEAFVGRLVRLAATYLAEFDGWGAPI
jgi:regulator of RNase E activity RraB